jgi:hypothetical protein
LAPSGSLRLSTSEPVPAVVVFGVASAIAETNMPFRLQICNQAKSEVAAASSASSTASADIGSRPISVTCRARNERIYILRSKCSRMRFQERPNRLGCEYAP